LVHTSPHRSPPRDVRRGRASAKGALLTRAVRQVVLLPMSMTRGKLAMIRHRMSLLIKKRISTETHITWCGGSYSAPRLRVFPLSSAFAQAIKQVTCPISLRPRFPCCPLKLKWNSKIDVTRHNMDKEHFVRYIDHYLPHFLSIYLSVYDYGLPFPDIPMSLSHLIPLFKTTDR